MRICWDWQGALTGPTKGFMILGLFAALAVPGAAHAQGSRKDDIVLNRFGQPVAGATITVCTSGATGTPCSPLASVYSDVGLTQPLANPLTSDGQGNYHFYAAPARYVLQLSGAGITTTTIPDVLLPADPTSPSFQSLSVTQNISALNLNLSGNLSVSGGVSSPSTLSAPQQGSAAPVQIGPHWYAGTASGQCSTPAAPAVVVETISSGTGTIGTASYQYRVALFNRNGITSMGPATTYAAPSGTTNRILVQLGSGDYSYRSGCYGYRVYVSSDGGNTWWRQNAWTLPSAGISSWTANAAGVVTVTTTAAHGFIPGESITIAGAATGTNSTSINGTFTLVGQQVSTPSTLFFFRSSTTADSSSTAQGTGTVVAGLGADPAGHFAPGDFIISTILTSGTQGPAANTATIDPIQVALNATCNYATNSCAAGRYDVSQGTTTLTTPLILSNQQTVAGVTSANALGKSKLACSWTDPNLGCVTVMGVANGVRLEGTEINSAGHALMLTGWGPSFGSSNIFVRNNQITTTDQTGQYSAIYFHKGYWLDMHFENNLLNGGLAAVQTDAIASGWVFFSGARWNGANLHSAGLSTNGLLSVSSVSDPDRAQALGGLPSASSLWEISNMIYQSGTGVLFDATNIALSLRNVLSSDSATISGTPAVFRLGNDSNSGSGTTGAVHIENTTLLAGAGVSTGVQLIGNFDGTYGPISIVASYLGGTTNEIDFNNVSVPVIFTSSAVDPYEGASSRKIINVGPTATQPLVVNSQFDGAQIYGQHQLLGGIMLGVPNATGTRFHLFPISGSDEGISYGDPATAANVFIDFSGSRMRWWQSAGFGSSTLFDVWGGAQNQINLIGPANNANGYVTIGGSLRFENGSATSGHYFQFAGTPTAPRLKTWQDTSGTVAETSQLPLAGTTGSLGGSALTAGTCSSTTVTVSGATTSMTAAASPSADPGSGYYWLAFVSSSNTVTVRVCAAVAGTPTSTTYNVRVIQ